ncbi:MAG: hypothetical protein AAB512_03970 [Patescibacteria group bacterium]
MSRFLPLVFLVSIFSLFGIVWIIWDVDPTNAPLYVFAILTLLVTLAVWGFLGLSLYFIRTRFYRRFSKNWYIYTSFKMAFFVALFAGLACGLTVIKLISIFNLMLAILAVGLFATWSFLGKK